MHRKLTEKDVEKCFRLERCGVANMQGSRWPGVSPVHDIDLVDFATNGISTNNQRIATIRILNLLSLLNVAEYQD